MALAARARRPNAAASACRFILSASIWRGRCDPLGDRAAHVEEIVPILSGPIDNYTPRIVTARQVDNIIREQYAELDLAGCWRKIGIYRSPKQQIKKPHYKSVVYPPVYAMAFEDPEKPLHVDIGSGDGKMIMLLAKRSPGINFLGLDKSPKRIDISSRFQEVLDLRNLHFVCCNASISLETILATYPGPVKFVSIMCPDPYLSGMYYRIRMITKDVATAIVRSLAPGGKILFQTEFEAVAWYLRRYFEKHLGTYVTVVDKGNSFVYDEDGWLLLNPLGVRSETEIDTVAHGQKMWRRFYERSDEKFVEKVESDLLVSDIEAPTHREPMTKDERRRYRLLEHPKLTKNFPRRKKCNLVRRLPDGVARDMILNWETYPRGWFLRLMQTPGKKKIKKKRFVARTRILPLHKRPLVVVREDIG